MEHPPKQGLKQATAIDIRAPVIIVLMEHPPKQGLKRGTLEKVRDVFLCFNGTSTKTRIETCVCPAVRNRYLERFNGTSTKTRIETKTGNPVYIKLIKF